MELVQRWVSQVQSLPVLKVVCRSRILGNYVVKISIACKTRQWRQEVTRLLVPHLEVVDDGN